MGISLNLVMSWQRCMYYLIFHFGSLPFVQIVYVGFSDLNRLIMDYLVIQGYKSAAEEFSQEAGLSPPVDFESIESRMNIREALQRGDVEDAITRVNDLNPEVSIVDLRYDLVKGLYPSCTTLRPFWSVMTSKHQNFSLQYDSMVPSYVIGASLTNICICCVRFWIPILLYIFGCNNKS